jgi:predicted glycogen debranching enzyme
MVLVNGLEAWVETASGRHPLSTHRYLPNVQYPDGQRFMTAFRPTPWPCWTYALPNGGTIEHEVLVNRAACETVLRWRRTQGEGSCRLEVRPFISGRDYHALHRENPVFDFAARTSGGNVAWRPYPDLPAITALTNATYHQDPEWFRNFLYVAEQARGLDHVEDLASPGVFSWDLALSEAVMILRTGDDLDPDAMPHAGDLVTVEQARRSALPGLMLAADQYLVSRGAGRTLLAGFPWFTDWGRDTFIAMRGLMLATGRLKEAGSILESWAAAVDQGMLPNRFPDRGDAPEYNAVDASLWFIIAARAFLDASAAASHLAAPASQDSLQQASEAILQAYAGGTRYGIVADADGLLKAGVPGVQLTWMDAKVGDWVVTPRIGKPVEVQALWINALHIGSAWAGRWRDMEARARSAFLTRFPDPKSGGLYDVVDADHAAGAVDARIRPNQIFAVGGLPFPILEGEAAKSVVALVEARLLTPLGLRSLARGEPGYAAHYGGGPRERDGAYHQGTVWPWLIGPFVEAWLRIRGGTEAAKAEARSRFLAPFFAQLNTAGLGHISEITDAEPPYRPGGCPFQAWSLGELIRLDHLLAPASTAQR